MSVFTFLAVVVEALFIYLSATKLFWIPTIIAMEVLLYVVYKDISNK